MLDYQVQAADKSMYNTPPCWSIYICGLVFAKMRRDGGLPAVQQLNEKVRSPSALAAATLICAPKP
jgi:phosphoserine aminotransferase